MQGAWETIAEKRITLTQAREQIKEYWKWLYMLIENKYSYLYFITRTRRKFT